jgi:hypothetical protein
MQTKHKTMTKSLTYYVRLQAETDHELLSLSPQEQLDLARGLIEAAQEKLRSQAK